MLEAGKGFSASSNFRTAVNKAVHRDFPHLFCSVLEQFLGSGVQLGQLKDDTACRGFTATRIFATASTSADVSSKKDRKVQT